MTGRISHCGLRITPGRLHFRLLTGSAADVTSFAGSLESRGIAVRVLEQAYGVGTPGDPHLRPPPPGQAKARRRARARTPRRTERKPAWTPGPATRQLTITRARRAARGGRGLLACVCFEITGPEILPGHWRPGPLPVALPDGRHADRQARSSYFQARAADSLYGTGDRASQLRWHRAADPHPIDGGSGPRDRAAAVPALRHRT